MVCPHHELTIAHTENTTIRTRSSNKAGWVKLPYICVLYKRKSLLLIDYPLTFEAGFIARRDTQIKHHANVEEYLDSRMRCVKYEMLTAIIIVARVQPGTSKGITDLLLPQPSSGLRK